MIRRTIHVLQFWLVVADLLVLPVAFWLAYYVRFHSELVPFFSEVGQRQTYVFYFFVAWPLWALLMNVLKLESVDLLHQLRTWVIRATWGTITLVGSCAVVAFFLRHHFSRIFMVLFACLHLLLLVLVRRMIHAHLRHLRTEGRGPRVLVVGKGELVQQVVKRLESSLSSSCQVVPSLYAGGTKRCDTNPPGVSGEIDLATLPAVYDEIVVAVPLEELLALKPVLQKLKNFELPTRIVLNVEEFCDSSSVFDFSGLPVASLGSYPGESIPYIVLKRVFDVVFSACVLVLVSPLLACIAVGIALTMGRPIVFIQKRVGLNGKPFMMYKFRTMAVAMKEQTDTEWSKCQHPRLTRLGRFLRRFNLDELPQFYNVLKGEMSVVGPRPERPYFVEQFSQKFEAYPRRHHFRAGVTGWAQSNGLRQDTPIDERLRYDLHYIQNWSLWFDVKIILLTLARGFRDRSAY